MTSNKFSLKRGLAIACSLTLLPFSLSASDLYWGAWDGVTTTAPWGTAGNWYTNTGETTPSGAAPTLSDDLFFNSTPDAARGGTINLSGNVAFHSLTYNTSAASTISQNGVNRSLTLGNGGITVNSGAGALTIGLSSASLSTEINASQTWINNSASTLTVRSTRVSDTATGAAQLTVNAANSGSVSLLLGVKDSPDNLKALTLVVNSTGSGEVSTVNASTHTGGTIIRSGILKTRTDMGTGSITMGHTSGSANTTLRLETNATINSDINVASSNTGTHTLEFISATSGSYAGDIALNNDLFVGVRNTTPGSTLSGTITGSGDLIKGQYQGSGTTGLLTLSGSATQTGNITINNGAFTLAQTGSITFHIGVNGVNNQLNGASTGSILLDGSFTIDLSGAVLADGNTWALVNVSNETYGTNFSIGGFMESSNIWTNGSGLSFNEGTGILSYTSVPEPSSAFFLMVGVGALLAFSRRRAQSRAW